MSGLSVGIVGLPNVGKSTLFNALMGEAAAFAANYPFATIDPNVGIVPVTDKRLEKLAETVRVSEAMEAKPPEVPATVEFVDIAGLIGGAHKGEGLGNKFLHNIRETDAIVHVVRAFSDDNIVREGSSDPKVDLDVIKTELALADLQTLENVAKKKKVVKENPNLESFLGKAVDALNSGKELVELDFTDDEKKEGKMLSLLTLKPYLVVLNVGEKDLEGIDSLEQKYADEFGVSTDQVVAISAKVEEDLAGLSEEDKKEYLSELGVKGSGMERLIRAAHKTLNLITFLTAGEKEVRAWEIKRDTDAQNAAGAIHTDFIKKFIKADVISFDDFVEQEGWKNARENGKVRQEGKEYIVKDGDVIEFKIGS